MVLPTALSMALKPLVDRATCHGVEDSVIVYCKEEIMNILLTHKYAYRAQWHAKVVGVHPCNRNGEGILWPRAQSRIVKIRTIGWSWTTSEVNAVNIEDHPMKKHIAKNTVKICSQSDKFAKYNVDEIKSGSLGAGHCNHGIAMVIDEVPCEFPRISEHGKMSYNKVASDPGFKEAIDKGMRWVTIRWEVEEEFPQIPSIIQSALNAVAQIAEGDKIIITARSHTPSITT
jgi:hypothetical protein